MPPSPNTTRQIGYQVGAGVLNYSDATSFLAHASWDARYFELTTKASNRFFPKWTDLGKEAERSFQGMETTLGVELARRYLSLDGRYGRMGIEYDAFLPDGTPYLRIGVNTGILPSEEVPWLLRLDIHSFIALRSGQSSRWLTALEAGYVFQTLRGGFGLTWVYLARAELGNKDLTPLPANTFYAEHMLFNIGPWVEWASKDLVIRLTAMERLSLDKEWSLRNPANAPNDPNQTFLFMSYPSGFSGPDFNFSLTWLF